VNDFIVLVRFLKHVRQVLVITIIILGYCVLWPPLAAGLSVVESTVRWLVGLSLEKDDHLMMRLDDRLYSRLNKVVRGYENSLRKYTN